MASKKPDWLFRQSAVIPFIADDAGVRIVIVTSQSGENWVIPKGVVERGMSPEESAAKEALEEAGVEGDLSVEVIGDYTYEKWGGVCRVQVFPLRVTQVHDAWDEDSKRERKVVPLEEAITLVKPEIGAVLPSILGFLGIPPNGAQPRLDNV